MTNKWLLNIGLMYFSSWDDRVCFCFFNLQDQSFGLNAIWFWRTSPFSYKRLWNMLANRLEEQTEGLLYGGDRLCVRVPLEWRQICYSLFHAVAARLCASIALISTRKLVLDVHKVGTRPLLVKHVISMHIRVWGPGRNILCFSLPFSVQRCCFSASIFTVVFVTLDLYSLLFCIKMKSWNTKYL